MLTTWRAPLWIYENSVSRLISYLLNAYPPRNAYGSVYRPKACEMRSYMKRYPNSTLLCIIKKSKSLILFKFMKRFCVWMHSGILGFFRSGCEAMRCVRKIHCGNEAQWVPRCSGIPIQLPLTGTIMKWALKNSTKMLKALTETTP